MENELDVMVEDLLYGGIEGGQEIASTIRGQAAQIERLEREKAEFRNDKRELLSILIEIRTLHPSLFKNHSLRATKWGVTLDRQLEKERNDRIKSQ